MQNHIISIEVEDRPGVLTRISSLFARRGYNIQSLAVGHTHTPGISRFTIVVSGNDQTLEQIRKQTQKLIDVLTTDDLTSSPSVMREFTLLKIKETETTKQLIYHIIDFYGGRLLDHSKNQLIVEFSGSEKKIDQIYEELKGVKVVESIRTGKIGMKL